MASITEWAKKIWKDRQTEYPTRRVLTKTDGSQEIVTVERKEGNVSQEGDAFSAANMNDLEERIDAGFADVNRKLKIKNIYSGKATVSSADWIAVTVEFGGTVADADKIIPMAVGLQIYDGNHIPNIMINEKTPTSFTASCYGLSAFQWVVLELY